MSKYKSFCCKGLVLVFVFFVSLHAYSSDIEEFTVFATRIGLIGETTASGHIIEEKDIFVALPSRKALLKWIEVSCNGKTAKCQVLDVGPWSTKDNYWDSGTRPLSESGKQLPERNRKVFRKILAQH